MSARSKVCPDCGNDDHELSADACWVCDCPLDAAPDPQRAYLKGMVRSDQVKRKGWFGGSVSVTTVVLVLGLSLLNPLFGIIVAVAMVTAAKTSKKHRGRDRTFLGIVLRVVHVITIIVMFIVGAVVAGIFVLYLICVTSSGSGNLFR